MHILHVVGARPNFMKLAPVYRALAARSVPQLVVHTGQHYDTALADAVWSDLNLPAPDVNLGVGSASHAQQTAQVIVAVEEHLLGKRPALMVVYGDVNSTMAATVAAAKLGVPVAHVEAGLRSRDRTMPEEINRVVTDQLSSFLFTPSIDASENLEREGLPEGAIHLVGNVMIDSLISLLPRADGHDLLRRFNLMPADSARPFALVTLHRPSNVDDARMLGRLIAALDEIAADIEVIFPVHPRTRRRLAEFNVTGKRLTLTEPLSYLEFLGLQRHARIVITDSGGIQEETTYLGVPCLTLRDETERPVTVAIGTNTLVGRDTDRLKKETRAILSGHGKKGSVPPLWDGRTAERIADHLRRN